MTDIKAAEPRTAWFTEARFGMMVHFGLYSIPAGVWNNVPMGRNDYAEWIQMQGNWPHGIPATEYQALAKHFNPERFDAREWIHELVGAGMRYLIVTSKHHDGFALWPSRVSDYNVMAATPFKRDIVGELRTACDEYGIRFGLYYSHWLDWEHPYGGRPHKDEFASDPRWEQPSQDQFEIYWQQKCLAQVQELLDSYDPALFWFDTWAANSSPWINERRIDKLIGLVRTRSPACLVNSRIGAWGHPRGNNVVDYVSMGDNEFPERAIDQPWETSATMRRSYGSHLLDFNWKPTRHMLASLIGNVARGGNYTLNCGPQADGTLSTPEIRRLREFGAWFAAHGESVHDAGRNPLPVQSWGEITSRKSTDGATKLYLHLTRELTEPSLLVAGVERAPSAAYVLETGQPLECSMTVQGLGIKIPREVNKEDVPVFVVDGAF